MARWTRPRPSRPSSRGWGCYNRHDFDAMEALYAPDAVLDVSRVYVDERPRKGREDMRTYWEEIREISGGCPV